LLLSARHVGKTYSERRTWPSRGARRVVHAFLEVTLDIPAGAAVGLVGASGCGKSSLARCLAGLESPDAGEVLLDGDDLYRLPPAELRRRRRGVQLVFQSAAAALNPWLSLEDIIAEPLAIAGSTRKQRREEAARRMQQVGLEVSWGRRKPHELSGGQRQRVALARALAASPRVLLLDEPCSGLDLPVQAQMVDLLLALQASLSLAYVFITHDLRLVGAVAREVAVMERGRIVEYAPTADLFWRPRRRATFTPTCV
jgi:peptide/nickel transport system ATP-binding protein